MYNSNEMSKDDHLDATFAALAHPTRRAILARLANGQATVNEIAEPFEMTLPAVSKHIHVLEAAGLIARGRKAQFRPCSIRTQPLQAVSRWTDQYRHIWEERFDAMNEILMNLKDANDE